MNTSGGLEDGVCQREGRLNHLVIGTQLGGLEAKGSQAAPPWGEGPPRERDPQQEGDPHGMGPPRDRTPMGERPPQEGDPHGMGPPRDRTPTGEGHAPIGLEKRTEPDWMPQAQSRRL